MKIFEMPLSFTFHDRRIWRPALFVLLIPALAKLLLHLLNVNGYGVHGDELYYLACSTHLDWGYVDQPPLSIFLLHLERATLGDSMLSIRLLPALAGFFTVLLSGLLARRMGAGLFGQALAELCALIAPVYLAVDHYFSMNSFDILFWIAGIYLVVCIIDESKPKLWLWFGAVMGLGFENKIGVLFLGLGLVAGLLLTKQRRLLFTSWALVGALVGFVIMLPNILWQVAHGWPTLEWIANARAQKMVALPLPAFMKEELLLMQPFTFFVWGTGLIVLLLLPSLARYRSLGWCYLIVLGVFVLQGGKPYYLAPIYPMLFAAGAIAIERWLTRPWMRTSAIATVLGAGILTAPMGMPLLPVENFLKYQDVVGLRPSSGEKWEEGKLPSFFANFFGWKELAAAVDTVYQSLPPEDKVKCGIFGQNYMQAGAVDFYGEQTSLPRAICGHNSYWLWGTRGLSAEVMIVMGGNAGDLMKYFEEVTERARFRNEYIQPMHSNIPIFLCRKPKYPLSDLWPKLRHYI